MTRHRVVKRGLGGATLVLALLLGSSATAQERPGLEVERRSLGTAAVESPDSAFAERLEVGTREERVHFTWPRELVPNRNVLLHTLRAERITVDYRRFSPSLEGGFDRARTIDAVGGAAYRLTWIKQLARLWVGHFSGGVGLFSDLEDVSSDDLRAEGSVAFERVLAGTGDRVGFGAAWTQAFGEGRLVPLLTYRRETRASVTTIRLPIFAEYRLRGNKWETGVRLRTTGNAYGVHEPLDPPGEGGFGEDDRVEYSVRSGAIFAERTLGAGFWIGARYGVTFDRTFEVLDDGGSTRRDWTVEDEDYWAFSLGFKR